MASLAVAAIAAETATPILTKVERLPIGMRVTWTYPTEAVAAAEAWRIQRHSDNGELRYYTVANHRLRRSYLASAPDRTYLIWIDKNATPGAGYTYLIQGHTEDGEIPASNSLRIAP